MSDSSDPPPSPQKPANLIGIGVALGAGISTAIGVAMNNIGVAIGMILGAGLDRQRKRQG